MEPLITGNSPVSNAQNGPAMPHEQTLLNNLPVKVKEEPPDWSLTTSPTSHCCAGGMPIHSSPQAMCPPPSCPLPAYPGQAPNGMIPQPLPGQHGLGPPPLSHPHPNPHPNPHPHPHINSQLMPIIKNEPSDMGYPPHPSCQQPGPNRGVPIIKQEPNPCLNGGAPPPAIAPATTTTKGKGSKAKKAAVKKETVKQEKITDSVPTKKKRDRFNGMSEEEVLKRTLPDLLEMGLDIVIVGINPGLTAAYVGHHYAGPGNHFWKCLYLSGLIPEPMNAYDDYKLKNFGIGFTNIVERTSRGSADLTRKEIKEGGEILLDKILKYKPKIAVFNGKGIYEVFAGHKNFYIGKQPEPFPGSKDTHVYVMPSSSARCSQLPRAVDKVPFYLALKRLRDYCRGDFKVLNDSEVTFPDLELKVEPRKDKEEKVKNEAGTKSRKRKSTDNEMLDNMAMNAMNFPNGPLPHGMPFPPPPGMMGPPMPIPPWQHPLPGMPPRFPPGMHGSQVPPQYPSMENLFGTPPVLVKQEDMTELTNYGITPATFSGQSYLGGCPAPQLPTVSLPGPWHGSSNTSASSTPGFPYMSSSPQGHSNSSLGHPNVPQGQSNGPQNHHNAPSSHPNAPNSNPNRPSSGPPASLPSPAAYHSNGSISSLSPHQMPNNGNNEGSFNSSYSSNGNQSYPSPNYMTQSNQCNLSPNSILNSHQTAGLSPTYPQEQPGSQQTYSSSQYQYNGSNGPNMSFG